MKKNLKHVLCPACQNRFNFNMESERQGLRKNRRNFFYIKEIKCPFCSKILTPSPTTKNNAIASLLIAGLGFFLIIAGAVSTLTKFSLNDKVYYFLLILWAILFSGIMVINLFSKVVLLEKYDN